MAFFIQTSPYNLLLKCKEDEPPFIRKDRAAKQREKFSRQNRKARNAQIARQFYANPEERRRANFGASSRASSFDSYFDEEEDFEEPNQTPKHSRDNSVAPPNPNLLSVAVRNDLASSSPEITQNTYYRHSSPELPWKGSHPTVELYPYGYTPPYTPPSDYSPRRSSHAVDRSRIPEIRVEERRRGPLTAAERRGQMRKQQSEMVGYKGGSERGEECVECGCREKTVVVEPCGHVPWCQSCARAHLYAPCPVCHLPVTSLLVLHQ